MIKNHIYPTSVIEAPALNDKIMMRYLRKMQDDVIDNIVIAKADRLSAKGPDITQEIIDKNISGLEKLLQFYFAQKDSLAPLPKLLDGKEIMTIRGLKQSPELGRIIKDLKEAQLSGDILTQQDAIKFVTDYKF